ncbi:zeta toxin family protein [Rhodococcus sp. NPDC003318]|uniref:zeta toxin family protein n=1 Tax=Rhodococcus sp. NPDC003318 TaxID=3364503 RepID=UPI0036B30EE8
MNQPRPRITTEFLDHIFATKVRRQVFEDAVRPETNRPVMIFVGAQPGAGKTRAMEMAVRDAARAHPVVISGDDFRQYHPDYRRLIAEDPTRMPAVTAELSGPMVRRSLDHAKQQRYSVALEGTFRDEAMVLATAHEFAQEGYEIHVVAVATQPEVSRLSIEDRYLSAPRVRARWTPPTAHDLTIATSGHVLETLEASDVVDRISVYTRAERVYRNERDRDGDWAERPRAREVLEAERARPLSPLAATEWLRDYARVVEEVRQRPDYLAGAGAHTHQQLDRDAEQVRAWARVVEQPAERHLTARRTEAIERHHAAPNPLEHNHHQPPAIHDPHHGIGPGRSLNL